MNRSMLLVLAAVFAFAGLATGCEKNPVGRTCFISSDAGPVTVVSQPALDCESRECLHFQGHTPDMCTGDCVVDEDCDKVAASECVGRFVCTVATVVGPFRCAPLCICSDYFENGVAPPTPAECATSGLR